MATTPPVFTDGEAYERMMGRWSRLAGETFLDWIAPARGLRWLDVGCGNGAFTELLVERCSTSAVTGIDPSEGQLDYARSRLDANDVDFRQGDALALPFEDNEFDAAAMALAINFVPDPSKAVAEMVRVVEPGGLIATYMWDVLGGGFTMEPLRKALKEIDIPTPIPGAEVVRIENLERLWNEAELNDVATRRVDITVTYADFEDFWIANTSIPNSVSNAIAKLAPADGEKLKERLRETLSTDADGRISYGACANAVKGRVP
ncbi:MAG: ubiquinone/menaquinone biosynthesis C-methylase UbiE [Alphaproteobacteria bacterium]|jgi:ubiquinone/menaquinone biosynthesis C-methylase UbiE